jgi:hypothetical protein
MPLFQSTAGKTPLILTKDRERIIAYTLTAAAAKRLRENGVRHGRTVPGRVLASLIRTGDAHSPRPADAVGQQALFEDDSADHLLRCELTGATTDLHLVVYGEGKGIVAKLVATEPRFLLQKVTTLSVPLAALSLAVIDTLETVGKLPPDTAAAKNLRQWLRQDLESGWKKLEKELAKTQQSLDLGPSADELPLTPTGERLPTNWHASGAAYRG